MFARSEQGYAPPATALQTALWLRCNKILVERKVEYWNIGKKQRGTQLKKSQNLESMNGENGKGRANGTQSITRQFRPISP